VLIIGAGPAGLSAAVAAAEAGARVILADEDFLPGGRANAETCEVDGRPAAQWAAESAARLAALSNVRLMTRTSVYGAFDHGIYCAGATERPIAFSNNDRPGIMLAGAVRAYANRWATVPGSRIAVFTNNDDGWRSATDLAALGVEISAVVDTRDITPPASVAGAAIAMGSRVTDTGGRKGLKFIRLADGRRIPADCLAVSGGWNPNVHLTCHQRGRPAWRDDIAAFVPGDELPPGMIVAGAANGTLTLGATLSDGWRAGNAALASLGISPRDIPRPVADDEPAAISAFWHVRDGRARAWLDLQNDVTVKDIRLAHQEGYRAVEHLKRYTTLGMATDQGKTANVGALAIMQAALYPRADRRFRRSLARPGLPPYPPDAKRKNRAPCSSRPDSGCERNGFRATAKRTGGKAWIEKSTKREVRSESVM
jgi:sarcosine oxidase subunit alpha